MTGETVATRDLLPRRLFVMRAAAGLSCAWASVHWPELLSAAGHAHRAAQSATPPQFEFFTAEEAKEIDAITARIIPTDDMPGAHEAGVVYFLDKALVTFAKDNQKLYRDGLPELLARVGEMYPGKKRFSELTPEDQDTVLRSFDKPQPSGSPLGGGANTPNFFEALRQHTITAFLIDPEAGRGGNLDAAGWKVIGRDPAHSFQPPFGYYDKDYPGWASTPKPGDKR